MPDEDPKSCELEMLVDEYVRLRGRMRQGLITDEREIVLACRAIGTRFKKTVDAIPLDNASRMYTLVRIQEEHPHIWQQSYNFFAGGPWRARQHNDARLLLLLVHYAQLDAMIRRPDMFPETELLHATAMVYDTMDEICATIPACLGYVTMDSATGDRTPAIM